MLKKKMAAGVVALAMVSTLGLSACSNGSSDSSSSSASGGAVSGSIPKPDVACDIPATNLDDSKIDTSKVEGEITFQTQGLKTDFGDFFTKKIKEFEDANPGVKIKWTDQAGGRIRPDHYRSGNQLPDGRRCERSFLHHPGPVQVQPPHGL